MRVFITAAKRTAIGSMLGSLKSVPAVDLGAEVVKQILSDTGFDPANLSEVIVGNVLPAGLGQGPGRQVAIKAGVPQEVPAYSINMVCGSGMKAVINAYCAIREGSDRVVIAGGTESMTRSAMLLPHTVRGGVKMGDFTVTDHMVFDSLTDAFSLNHMGITAENIAEKYGITREMQDEFAYASQQKAIKAVDSGVFKNEIVSVTVKEKKNEFVFDTDEHPNRASNPEKLSKLRPAFKKDGTVTAGNASGINDGAAFVMVASEDAVREYGLTPLAEIVATGQGGVDPQFMGLGPVPAIRHALKNAGKKLDDMDVLELNEAFAAQSLGVIKLLVEEHGVDRDALLAKTNVNGGAIALGHPVGASGCRILVSCLHELIRSGKEYGLASLCIGGGMGTAVIIKRV